MLETVTFITRWKKPGSLDHHTKKEPAMRTAQSTLDLDMNEK